jgi:tetratricopeptide (TPR) repeat protein
MSQNTDRRILEQGFLYEKNGKYNEAIETFLRLNLDEQRLSTQISVWNSLYKCYAAVGRYSESMNYLRKLLSVVDESTSRDAIWINISDNQWSLGDYAAMLCSLDSVSDQRLTVTRRINALVSEEKYDQALKQLKIFVSTSDDEKETAIALQNMGYVEWARGNLSAAAELLEKALQRIPSSSSNYPIVLSTYGYILGCSGKYAKGLEVLNRAIFIQKRSATSDNPDLLVSQRKKGEVELMAGMARFASKTMSTYFSGERSHLLETLSLLTPSQRLNYWAKEKPLLSKCFLLGDSDAEFLFEVAMFRRQTSLLGMQDITNLKELLSVTPRQIRSALKNDEAAVEIVSYESAKNKRSYAAIIMPSNGKARFVPLLNDDDIYKPETVGVNSLYNALKRESRNDKSILYSDSVWGNRIWLPVFNVLPRGVKKIYFAPEGIFHLFAIENLPFEGKNGKELHRVTSIASLIKRNVSSSHIDWTKTLLVGGLNYDNAVVDSVDKSHSNRDASDYIKQRDIGGNSKLFSYLRGTRVEVDSISQIISSASPHYKMNETTLKGQFSQYSVVHIATHGYSLDFGIRKRPELLADSIPYDKSLVASGLALSGANVAINRLSGEDELLSAREICDLDLSNVDFVVLSACETAKGNISDEGAAGLVRGLKNAGAKTILATLWKVDDTSTMLFMKEMYRQLNLGANKYDAYISAQNYVRNYVQKIPHRKFSPKTLARGRDVYYTERAYNDPYYWAPFILIDEY